MQTIKGFSSSLNSAFFLAGMNDDEYRAGIITGAAYGLSTGAAVGFIFGGPIGSAAGAVVGIAAGTVTGVAVNAIINLFR